MSLFKNLNLPHKDEIVTVQIQRDFERCESSGASGMFQVVSVTLIYENGTEEYHTDLIDQGDMFYNAEEVLKRLGLSAKDIEIELI